MASIVLAVGVSAKNKKWENTEMDWEDFVSRLSNTQRTNESYKQYIAAKKDEQGVIKDVGGYVTGFLNHGRRKPEYVAYRTALTLDIDFGTLDFWNDFTFMYDCEAVLHTTHKHSESSPRYRLIIPLDRDVLPDEYTAISRKVAEDLNINIFDPTTFEINRLMFWPSTSFDGVWDFQRQKGDFLCADEVLKRYDDWTDSSQWAYADSVKRVITDRAKTQENPLNKPGVVGGFCKQYPIEEAIEKFLSDKYEKGTEGRYTYQFGTTSNGLVIYDGVFAYSHHSTDPACGILCNAFDLVRIHKFGVEDFDSTLTGGRAPSFKLMSAFAADLPEVRKLMASENREKALNDFDIEGIEEIEEEENLDWMEQLVPGERRDEMASSSHNISLIFNNDSIIKGAYKYNDFDKKIYVFRSVPWHKLKHGVEPVKESDLPGIRDYFEQAYKIYSPPKVKDGLILTVYKNSFHPVHEFLENLPEWDGVSRIEYLPAWCFGCDDNAYTREILKVALTAAVARIYQPGCKYETVPVFVGNEGTGKSTFLYKLGGKWFSDSVTTVAGKTAYEQLQGAWIIELAELSALKKADAESVKHLISKREDTFRGAYKEMPETHKRQCVMFGTTNEEFFLKSSFGDRRFTPLRVHESRATLSVFSKEFDDMVPQIWAEAKHLYRSGQKLFLSSTAEKIARTVRDSHRATDLRTGLVDAYLDMPLPTNWDSKSVEARHKYFQSYIEGDDMQEVGTIERGTVCVLEIWCECLGKKKEELSRIDSAAINDIIKGLPGWEISKTKRLVHYGTQRIYEKEVFF